MKPTRFSVPSSQARASEPDEGLPPPPPGARAISTQSANRAGRRNPEPTTRRDLTKHAELRQELARMVDSSLRPHDPIPSERELAQRFGVSRATVRHALGDLMERGRIYKVQGRGTFVSVPVVRKEMRFSSFSEDMAARGLRASSRILRADRQPAGAVVGQALAVSPAEPVVRLDRLRLANGEPMCLEEVYLPEHLVGDIASALSEHSSLFEALQDRAGVRVRRADQEVKPTVVSEMEANLLGVPPLSPALLIVRVTYDDRDRRVEYAKSLYRGDRYSIELNLHRQ